MSQKSPPRDTLVVLQGQDIQFGVEFDAVGPFGAQVIENGEVVTATSLHPNSSEFEFEYTCDDLGTQHIQIIVEGPPEELASQLLEGGVREIDPEELQKVEVEHANGTWDVTVVEKDELYQTDVERIRELLATMALLYTLGQISQKTVVRLLDYINQLEEEHEDYRATTLDEYKQLEHVTNSQADNGAKGGNEDDPEETKNSVGRSLPDPKKVEYRWFRDVVRRLDDKDAKEEYKGEEKAVKDSENRLVEQFRTSFRFYIYRRVLPIMLSTLIIGVLVDQFVRPVPIQAYGLVANLIGTVILALNTTRGRYMIANLSLPQEDQTAFLRESYARQTAVTTAGLGTFFIGFAIQLVGILL